MSLRTRLILTYTLIIILCLSIVAAALLVMFQDYRNRLAGARLGDMATPTLVQVRALAQGRISVDQLWANLEEQAKETNTHILLLDSKGNIIRQAYPEGGTPAYAPKLAPKKLPVDRLRIQRGSYTTPEGESFLFIAYPLTGLFRLWVTTPPETLILAMPLKEARALWIEFAKPFLWAGLIALAVSIIIAVFLARSVYLPVRRLTNAAEQIAQGQYDQEVPLTGPEEVKGLALRFNQMAGQVKHSQQMLRDFVADVSHELRSPLTSIKGFAQAILDGTAKDKEAQLKAASVIEDESKRMMRLVDELLDLSRLQSGQITMIKEPVDIKELLQQCKEIFIMRAEEKGLQLSTNIDLVSPITGDIDRLEQVFNNLLDNAIKHTASGGKVNIIAQQPSLHFVEITVADTGPGIPSEQLPHVFERFYRADVSTKTGTGLGLAIAREIARAHGGDIKVNSKVGQGTEFSVRLPSSTIIPQL